MDYSKVSNSNNNASDLAKLKQRLKKWKRQSNSSSTTTTTNNNSSKKGSLSRSNSIKEKITFLRRTLSFNDVSTSVSNGVPKGFLAIHVGEEMKRFVIPTNYLSHQAFSALLKEAEEEFGFQQEGILRIPCEVGVFECILKLVEVKSKSLHNSKETVVSLRRKDGIVCGSLESQKSLCQSHYPSSPMCR